MFGTGQEEHGSAIVMITHADHTGFDCTSVSNAVANTFGHHYILEQLKMVHLLFR